MMATKGNLVLGCGLSSIALCNWVAAVNTQRKIPLCFENT